MIRVVKNNPRVFASTVDISDDVILGMGDGNDGVVILRSSILNANTALTDVLIGTPESQAIAANSLMISNITASGDIVCYVNKGGTSYMVWKAEGSTGNLVIPAKPILSRVNHPTAPTVAVNATSGNLNGNYYYRVSFVSDRGQTEGGIPSAVVAPATQQVDLSAIPTSSDTSVNSRKIYRTLAGGTQYAGLYYLVTTIADNTTTTYTDNVADGSLGAVCSIKNTTGGLITVGDDTWIDVGESVIRIGQAAGNAAMSGFFNTIIGEGAGQNATTASALTLIGCATGQDITTASSVTCLGDGAGQHITTADDSCFIGDHSGGGAVAITGNSNTGLGQWTFASLTSGATNLAVGINAGYSLTTGSANVFLGPSAGFLETTGSNMLHIHNAADAYPLVYGEFPNVLFRLGSTAASSGATLKNSAKFILRGNHWNAATTPHDFEIVHEMITAGATPATHGKFYLGAAGATVLAYTMKNTNGTISHTIVGAVELSGNVTMGTAGISEVGALTMTNGGNIQPPNVDSNTFEFAARDHDTGTQKVVGIVSAATDPWIGFGATGTTLKITNGNLLGFFAATPVAQQTGTAVVNAAYGTGDLDIEAEIIAAFNANGAAINLLRTAVNNLGLTTTV